MKTYRGTRTEDGARVTYIVDGSAPTLLPPRLDLRNHSPTGFEWGYAGSGPAQLSLALCTSVVGDKRGQAVYQRFKGRVIQHIESDQWELNEDTIRQAVEVIEREIAAGQPAA